MAILVIGINQNYASLEELEQIDALSLSRALKKFPHFFSEWVLVSTCNRTEVYAVTSDAEKGEKALKKLFRSKKYYFYQDQKAVKHLYSVASGVDSVILGETEILAQIKLAYKSAMDGKIIGPVLHQLFRESLKVGKGVRHSTGIGAGMISLAQIAITVARKQVKEFRGKNVLVIGAGIIGQKLVKSLLANGVSHVSVVNRTDEKAKKLASKYGIEAVAFSDLENVLYAYDVIMSATSSPTSLIKAMAVKKAMEKRSGQLCIIDLAVPRDIEQNVSKIAKVSLYNIDDLQKLAASSIAKRKKALGEVDKIINEEVEKFWEWQLSRRSVPLITALNRKAEEISQKELALALSKLRHMNLTSREKLIISQLSRRIARKMIAQPVANIKKYSNNNVSLEELAELFDVEV